MQQKAREALARARGHVLSLPVEARRVEHVWKDLFLTASRACDGIPDHPMEPEAGTAMPEAIPYAKDDMTPFLLGVFMTDSEQSCWAQKHHPRMTSALMAIYAYSFVARLERSADFGNLGAELGYTLPGMWSQLSDDAKQRILHGDAGLVLPWSVVKEIGSAWLRDVAAADEVQRAWDAMTV